MRQASGLGLATPPVSSSLTQANREPRDSAQPVIARRCIRVTHRNFDHATRHVPLRKNTRMGSWKLFDP